MLAETKLCALRNHDLMAKMANLDVPAGASIKGARAYSQTNHIPVLHFFKQAKLSQYA